MNYALTTIIAQTIVAQFSKDRSPHSKAVKLTHSLALPNVEL